MGYIIVTAQVARDLWFLLVFRLLDCTREWTARVRACNFVKLETGWNLPPVLKIVTRTGHAV